MTVTEQALIYRGLNCFEGHIELRCRLPHDVPTEAERRTYHALKDPLFKDFWKLANACELNGGGDGGIRTLGTGIPRTAV